MTLSITLVTPAIQVPVAILIADVLDLNAAFLIALVFPATAEFRAFFLAADVLFGVQILALDDFLDSSTATLYR